MTKKLCVPPVSVFDNLGASELGPGTSEKGLPMQEPGGISDLTETHYPQLSAWTIRSLVKGLNVDDYP